MIEIFFSDSQGKTSGEGLNMGSREGIRDNIHSSSERSDAIIVTIPEDKHESRGIKFFKDLRFEGTFNKREEINNRSTKVNDSCIYREIKRAVKVRFIRSINKVNTSTIDKINNHNKRIINTSSTFKGSTFKERVGESMWVITGSYGELEALNITNELQVV